MKRKQIVVRFRTVSQLLGRPVRRPGAPPPRAGLSRGALAVLAYLGGEGAPRSMRQIAAALGASGGGASVAIVLLALARRGLIEVLDGERFAAAPPGAAAMIQGGPDPDPRRAGG